MSKPATNPKEQHCGTKKKKDRDICQINSPSTSHKVTILLQNHCFINIILRTRRVRAGKKAKQRSCAIPVILGRRNERSTQVYFFELKLPYYQDVNKPSKLRSTANNLINSSAHDHAQNHKNLIVVTSREQNNSKDLIALQNWQSNSQCLSFNAATINCESANN